MKLANYYTITALFFLTSSMRHPKIIMEDALNIHKCAHRL